MKHMYEYSLDPLTGVRKIVITLKFGNKKFINKYTKQHDIIKCKYSTVCLVNKKRQPNKLAICKIVSTPLFKKDEFIIPNSIPSDKIVKIREIYQAHVDGEDKTFLIMDHHPNAIDVFDYVNNNDLRTEDDLRHLVRGMCLALRDCHEAGYCHGDVKMENFIIVDDNIILIDFGFAFRDNDESKFYGGTRRYIAPEVVRERHGTRASDIWSIGIVLFYTITATDYRGKLSSSIISKFEFSRELVELLDNVLNKDPLLRPTIQELLEYDWFKTPEPYPPNDTVFLPLPHVEYHPTP